MAYSLEARPYRRRVLLVSVNLLGGMQMQIIDTTPVIIAAGQVVDRLGEGWRRLSPADLAAEAVRTALDGTGIDDLASR